MTFVILKCPLIIHYHILPLCKTFGMRSVHRAQDCMNDIMEMWIQGPMTGGGRALLLHKKHEHDTLKLTGQHFMLE